jgi:uncharacterized DUF497 family protein
VEIEFDLAKDEANRIKHGVPLSAASSLDLTQAIDFADRRHRYGEERDRRRCSVEKALREALSKGRL